MATYLARRIYDGKLNYNTVVAKYPQYKEQIDQILTDWGYEIPVGE